jgi:hypothetical protein
VPYKKFNKLQDEFFAVSKRMKEAKTQEEKLSLLRDTANNPQGISACFGRNSREADEPRNEVVLVDEVAETGAVAPTSTT